MSLKNYATHIVGGEMIYDYLGSNNYRITLKIYRDCSSQVTFDGLQNTNGTVVPAIITVLQANGGQFGVFDIGAPLVTLIPPTINSPCIQTPNNVCVEEGIYTYTVTLPAITGGYHVIYQRCCRNGTIINLLNPGTQGSTYYTKIPGPEDAINNNSPRFKNFPPIFLCNNLSFKFDHSAIDPDGDKLVYSLCPPFIGADGCCPSIGNIPPAPVSPGCSNPPSVCPNVSLPPPYPFVSFVTPYSGSYPIASNPSISIDPNTGKLTGTPNLIGQYVVGVCVEEYRNNVLISTHFRDFQFNIVSCVVSVLSAVADQPKQCVGNTISFVNQSVSNTGALTFLWDFGDPNIINDTSNAVNPTFTYQDTGIYVVTLISNPRKPCGDTVQKVIYVYPPLSIAFKPPQKQCLKNNSFQFKADGAILAQTTYTWNFTSKATPSLSQAMNPAGISFSEAGLFFVKLNAKQFACRDSFVDSVRVLRRPQAKINNLPVSLCDPATVTFSNGSMSDLPLKYIWRFSNGKSFTGFETTQRFSPPGNYTATLTVITQSICIDTGITSFNDIVVKALPVAGFSMTPEVTSIFDPEISVFNKASFDVVSWNYYFGDGQISLTPSDRHIYVEPGNYVITQIVTNANVCSDTARRIVVVYPEFRFWIPNTFTPDDNNLNDVFKPIVIGVINYSFEIYDRWGEKIFETGNVEAGWNGTFRGSECKEGIYAWRIRFKNIAQLQNEERIGHVLILKNL